MSFFENEPKILCFFENFLYRSYTAFDIFLSRKYLHHMVEKVRQKKLFIDISFIFTKKITQTWP